MNRCFSLTICFIKMLLDDIIDLPYVILKIFYFIEVVNYTWLRTQQCIMMMDLYDCINVLKFLN